MGFFLPGTRPPARRARAGLAPLWVLAGALLAAGCDDGFGPDELPLGRTGEVTIGIQAPFLRQSPFEQIGTLEQTIQWKSNGTWRLTERISYRGVPGDETVRRSTEDPGTLAQSYANLIARVNAPGGPVQIVDLLSPDLVPVCPQSHQSIVSIEIVDARRSTNTKWSRCGSGTLANLTSEGIDDPESARVVEAARQVRSATLDLDREWLEKGYAYTGSLPFKTVERGEVTKAPLLVPRLIEDAATLTAFWAQYMTTTPPPMVDFSTEVVLVAAVGTRQEAGDSVEIRRVLEVAFGTRIELWERRPGHFCTPAPRVHTPFHVAVAPIALSKRPIFFEQEVKPDEVPCG